MQDLLTGRRGTDEAIDSIVIETSFTPPIVIEKPLAGGGQGQPSALLKLLAPRITINTQLRAQPYVSAPYGEPGKHWPKVKIGLIVAGVLGVGLLVRRML